MVELKKTLKNCQPSPMAARLIALQDYTAWHLAENKSTG